MVSVFIPTLGRSHLLGQLLSDLRKDTIVEDITVADNGIDNIESWGFVDWPCKKNNVTFIDQRKVGFYAMWNQAISRARETTGKVAILNDDIAIPPKMITYLHRDLVAHDLTLICPDYEMRVDSPVRKPLQIKRVHGTYRHGGITGSAFLIDAFRAPVIDERFRIWYGDDDLVWKIKQAGGSVAVLKGLPLDHEGSLTVNSTSWVPAAIREDVALWESLGRGPA